MAGQDQKWPRSAWHCYWDLGLCHVCPLFSTVSLMELKQVEMPDGWSCLLLPCVCHQVLVCWPGWEWSFENSSHLRRVCAPLCSSASCYLLGCAGQFVAVGRSTRVHVVSAWVPASCGLVVKPVSEDASWSDISSIYVHNAPAPSHGSDLCWDTGVERELSGVVLGFFPLVLNLVIYLAYFWLVYTWRLHTSLVGFSQQRELWLIME